MAKLKVFNVFDSCAGLWLKPMYYVSKGQAVRAFAAAVAEEKHEFSRWAADYTLFEVGEYDEHTGRMELFASFVPIGTALEFKDDKDSIAAVRRDRVDS